MSGMNCTAIKRIGVNMDEDLINLLCQDVASETLSDDVEAYCDKLDFEWMRDMELANPRFFGPDYDETF